MSNRHAIEVVEAFRTSDGEVYFNIAEAINYQTEIELKEDLLKLLEPHLYRDMGTEETIEILVEQRKKLKHLFAKMNN